MFNISKTPMDSLFQKDKLEEQLTIHKVSRDQVLRETLGKKIKEFNNWKVKWSRLVNKKHTDPHNFGLLELSELLAEYFNKKRHNGLPVLSSTHFITKTCIIDVCGAFMQNGQVRSFNKKDYWKLKVIEHWGYHKGIIVKQGYMQGSVRFIKKLDQIRTNADYTLSVVRQKKTKILYWGWLIPQSNGKYNIEDRSVINDKKISDVVTNIDIDGSSKIESIAYPKESDWTKPKK